MAMVSQLKVGCGEGIGWYCKIYFFFLSRKKDLSETNETTDLLYMFHV